MNTKALLISNSSSVKRGKRGTWHLFEEAQPYIQGIDTNIDKDEVNAETLASLVSGVPTPWARARLFGFAFPYTQVEANIKRSGLVEFYEELVAEWKGLLATLALYPDRITVSEPITMDPRNEDPSLFYIPHAMGRMLFEDVDLWSDPEALAKEPSTKPFIQLIYYAGNLVGATSPYSLLFTAASYDDLPQTGDLPWYREGAFTDPLRYLSNDQKQKLYLLVSNIIDTHFLDFEKKVNSNRGGKPSLGYEGFKDFLRTWKEEIRNSGTNIVDEGTLDATLDFAEPYYPLFNVKQTLYFFANGRVSFKTGDGSVEVDPKEILLQEEHILEFKETDGKQPLAKSAVYYLTAPNPDFVPGQDDGTPEKLFFAIPLSQKGYLLFKNRIGDLLAGTAADFHELRAHIKATEFKLVVELFLIIDDKKLTPIVKEYDLQPVEHERSVAMWPNFISENWTQYYLYTEFPQNDKGTQMVPFFRDAHSLTPLTDDRGKLMYAGSDNVDPERLRVESLVQYPNLALDMSFHKYDIMRANKPMAGLELRRHIDGTQRVVGYVILKNPLDESMGEAMLRDYSTAPHPERAMVGIDFGSNNSCVFFAREDGTDAAPISFANRRVFLVGTEVVDRNLSRIALPHELYFFQNISPNNGQVKSWLHEHDSRYMAPGMEDQEIAGGVPIFKPNIHIKDMNDRTITTNAGTLHHSMKWLTESGDVVKKMAYLRTLWSKAVADLYAGGYQPSRLRWSYPGSFTQSEVTQYRKIYSEVIKSTPLKGASVELDSISEASTESEAVSNYALGTDLALGSNNLFLGIDMGGSTSDILIIGLDRENRANRLMKQSSVRLAAGYLMNAIKSSAEFRQALLQYLNKPETKIKIPNIDLMNRKPHTGPFFLNAIFDRLEGDEFERFYGHLSMRIPSIFALPTYMTGLLMYYSGQLVAKTMGQHAFLMGVQRVNLFPFGKGGRMFDWLEAHAERSLSQEYYTRCFRAGFGDENAPIELIKEDGIRRDNKSEVAKGLVSTSSGMRVQSDTDLRHNSDIFGEEGFLYFPKGGEKTELKPQDVISADHFRELQFDIEFPQRYEQFERFLEIFLEYVGPSKTGILGNTTHLKARSGELYSVLKGYITNDREFKKASRNKDHFEFKHSMLVLEGMCYLEKFLIPEVYKR